LAKLALLWHRRHSGAGRRPEPGTHEPVSAGRAVLRTGPALSGASCPWVPGSAQRAAPE